MIKKIIIAVFALFLLFSQQTVIAGHAADSDYHLPYPGILPDHPAYIIKSIRDRIEEFLISSPLENAEYNIEKADVRISASFTLAHQKNNIPLARDTAIEAENYFREAFFKTKEAKNQGMEINETVKRLNQASLKYLEIIKIIEEKTNKNENEKFKTIRNRLESLSQEIAP